MAVKPILLVLCASCASSVPAARFANAPVVTVVNDRHDVPHVPEERLFLPNLYFYDSSVNLPVHRALSLPRQRRALGVNALDEAPDSTWFTNRNATHALSIEALRIGPVSHDPDAHRPWAIQSSKIGGTTLGFIVKDGAGIKYLIKFDGLGDPPEMETATHVICNRIMWAAGYNVAEDQILYIHPADLVMGKGAKRKDELGKTLGLLRQADIDLVMKQVRHEPDGRIRTLVSRWIDGVTIGGFSSAGVREDDPNDLIPHEHRRDVRGMLTVDTWLDAVDITEGQFVDAYVDDPSEPHRHYIKHYAIDFGKSLGAMGQINHDWWRGRAYRVDYSMMIESLLTLGFSDRSWEKRTGPTNIQGVSALFDVTSLEPDNWHPDTPGFIAFQEADRFDQFWGTKLVMSFTPEQIRAAVEAGKLSDPRAVEYLTDTLVKRQRVLESFWFSRVNPIDRITTDTAGSLCFDDLAITTRLTEGTATRYAITAFDFAGTALGQPHTVAATTSGHLCASQLPTARDHEGYTIYRITTLRGAYAGTTYAHVARDPASKTVRVIGLWRP